MQVLKAFMDIFRHKYFSRLHFGHRWFTHFKCASEFSRLCHTFFRWRFILGRGAYQWSSSLRGHTSYFEHFVFMCCSLTFLSYLDNTSFFFLHVSFGEFWQESYACMWEHYGSMVMEVYLWPFNMVSSLITNLLWWYKPFFHGKLCHICFFKELGFGGFVFVL